MNVATRALRAADAMQQRHTWLAVPVAVWKKASDDRAGSLAALITFYSFVAIFPLLLVLVTALDIVLGLIFWLYLEAELTLYAVEANVVRAYRLWPRSIAPPPYTEQDLRAYQLYAQMERAARTYRSS